MPSRKFFLLLAGGLIIQASVSVKDTLETLKINDMKIEMASKGGFILGWAVVAYSIALNGNRLALFNLKTLLAVTGAVAIVVGVAHIKASEKKGAKPNKFISMGFPIGWVLIMLAIMKGSNKNKKFAIMGTALVLGSMMFVIPWQRGKCLVDGPGYNMFVNAWWLLAIANGG